MLSHLLVSGKALDWPATSEPRDHSRGGGGPLCRPPAKYPGVGNHGPVSSASRLFLEPVVNDLTAGMGQNSGFGIKGAVVWPPSGQVNLGRDPGIGAKSRVLRLGY